MTTMVTVGGAEPIEDGSYDFIEKLVHLLGRSADEPIGIGE